MSFEKKNTIIGINHHAERFCEIKRIFDIVGAEIELDLEGYDTNLMGCIICDLKDCKGSSGPRKTIPVNTINDILNHKNNDTFKWIPVKRAKLPVTWFVCLAYNIMPDILIEGWETFQVSHLCRNCKCVNHDHLTWESARVNQSRSSGICTQICSHCDQMLCVCQNIHTPHCI